jgi:glycosyltransferase involved in cell wall biosynthesis
VINKKTIVISAVNFSREVGGAYSVLKECLDYVSTSGLTEKYRFVTILHSEDACPHNNVECITFPKAKQRWIYRLYYEYVYFYRISKRLKPELWLSLHDITPNVIAKRHAVYMHNTSPFYKLRLKDFKLDWNMSLMTLFYKYLYRINIHKNNYLIVQQDWIRNAFSKMFNVDKNKIIVAYPKQNSLKNNIKSNKKSNITHFFYPSVPRIFKNFEIVCEAVKILNDKRVEDFEVTLTINEENTDNYSKMILKKYNDIKHINFVGLLPHNKMDEEYERTDCLIFPSKSETWGLPISEFSHYDKPMLLADLPYSHTAASGCRQTAFFPCDNPNTLALQMLNIINNDLSFLYPVEEKLIDEPFADSWKNLFKILLEQ